MVINSNGNSSLAYNNFMLMPQIPYKIVEFLMMSETQSANMLWKLLKYATVDALSNVDLTLNEKRELLWTPSADNSTQENLFSVFLKPLVPSALNEATEQIQLRIYRYVTKPNTRLDATMAYRFEIITQEFCSMVLDNTDTLVERTDLIEACLLDCLNGADLGAGSSFFSFDAGMMNNQVNSTLSINNGKSLYGRYLTLALRYVDVGVGGCI